MKKNSSIFGQALKYLSFRARSEKEMRDYLLNKGHSSLEIDHQIASLKGLNLINDVEFAKLYSESRARSRPRSNWLVNLELKRKGVNPPVAATLSDLELAQLALEKKKTLKSADQAARFLKSRGFNWETIEKALQSRYNEQDVN